MKLISAEDWLRSMVVRLNAENSADEVQSGDWLLIKEKDKPYHWVARALTGVRSLAGGKSDDLIFERKLTEREKVAFQASQQGAEERCQAAQKLADKLQIPMRFFDARVGWEGKTLSWLFTADEAVDFRELLPLLIKEFPQKRLHLQRCSRREKVRIMGGIGPCGRVDHSCCHFLNLNAAKVPMDAVRDQGIPIRGNNRLFGLSGGIKECMLYERDFYRQRRQYFPHIQQEVTIPQDRRKGRVVGVDLLSNQVKVAFEEGVIDFFALSAIQFPNQKPLPPEPELTIKMPSVDWESAEMPSGTEEPSVS